MQLVEVAIVVDREWHDRGIGSTLLRYAAGLARERGFKAIRSIESVANCAALEVERAAGFVVRPCGSASGLAFAEARLALRVHSLRAGRSDHDRFPGCRLLHRRTISDGPHRRKRPTRGHCS